VLVTEWVEGIPLSKIIGSGTVAQRDRAGALMATGVEDRALSGMWSAAPSSVVRVGRWGAIQAINERGLVAFARRTQCVLVLAHSVGDFVATGAGLVEVYGTAPP